MLTVERDFYLTLFTEAEKLALEYLNDTECDEISKLLGLMMAGKWMAEKVQKSETKDENLVYNPVGIDPTKD